MSHSAFIAFVVVLSSLADVIAVESQVEVEKFSVKRGVSCRTLYQMLRSKQALARQLVRAVNDTLTRPGSMTHAERKVQAEIIELFRQELDGFEASVFKSLNGLDRALAAHYWSLPSVKANFKRRLEGLKIASLHEEENFNAIVELEKRQDLAEQEHEKDIQRNKSTHDHNSHRNAAEKLIQDIVNGVVDNVVAAADKLENDMQNEQLFEHSKKKEGAKLETVIKLEEEEEGARGEPGPEALGKKVNGSAAMKKGILSSDVDGAVSVDGEQKKKKKRKARKTGAMSVLIDTHGNKYVLAEPARKTISHRDWHLLNNLCLIITVAFLLGSVCQLLGIPSLFGYVLCGVIVGPPGFNSVQSLVQLETLGEIGVYLLLFCVGLEFSLGQLREVWLIAVCGGGATTAVLQVASLIAGLLLNILPQQGCFVAACLTLSSTHLAMRVLAKYDIRRSSQTSHTTRPLSRKDRLLDSSDDLGDVGVGIFGILMMQDIFLALFITLLPLLAQQIEISHEISEQSLHQPAATTTSKQTSPAAVLTSMGSGAIPTPDSGLLNGIALLVLRTCCLGVISYVSSILILPRLFGFLFRPSGDKYEQGVCITLGGLTVLVVCVNLTAYIGISMEFGCFLAGMLISSQGHQLTQRVLVGIEPVKHLLSAIFFVTIGFHVFPKFIINQFAVVMVLTTAVVLVKFSVTYMTISCLLTAPQRWMIGLASASVAQVSECAFLVGSRGHSLGVISREVYLLLLCITTVSQLVAPVLWYFMSNSRSKLNLPRWIKLPVLPVRRLLYCRQVK